MSSHGVLFPPPEYTKGAERDPPRGPAGSVVDVEPRATFWIPVEVPPSVVAASQAKVIDRFGQTESPVLRYLQVNTEQGLLTGDKEIFDRLVAKVEEINRSRRQGESVLKLYDPEAEERYIAEQGILPGNVDVLDKVAAEPTDEANELESLLSQANITTDDDFTDWLLGDADADDVPPQSKPSGDGLPASWMAACTKRSGPSRQTR